MKRVWIAVLLACVLMAGCTAPIAVRGAHDLTAEAVRVYSANAERILDTALSAYEAERRAVAEEKTEASLRFISDAVESGASPVEIELGVRALIAEREATAQKTAALLARFRALETANRVELAKMLRLHGAVGEWLEAGVDSSAVPALVQELVEGLKDVTRRQNP